MKSLVNYQFTPWVPSSATASHGALLRTGTKLPARYSPTWTAPCLCLSNIRVYLRSTVTDAVCYRSLGRHPKIAARMVDMVFPQANYKVSPSCAVGYST